MNVEGYRFLASALLEKFGDVKLSRKVENREEMSRNKQVVDRAAKRKAWVSTNDSSLQRSYMRKTILAAVTLEAMVEAVAAASSGEEGGTSQDFRRETPIKPL
jgi:hypothetical protein